MTPFGLYTERNDLSRRGLLYQNMATGRLYVRADGGPIPEFIKDRLDPAMAHAIGPAGVVAVP